MYRGFYINLASDHVKRTRLEENLRSAELLERYCRFDAVAGSDVAGNYSCALKDGELGCWLSHLSILHNQILSTNHIHIVEDDVLIHKDIAKIFAAFTKQIEEWDVLFTDFFLPHDIYLFKLLHDAMRHYKITGNIKIFRLDNIKFTCATSYFVNNKSIRKLYNLLCNCGNENIPFDLKLRDAANSGKLSAYATIPFYSSLSETSQDSSIRTYDMFRKAFDLYRRSFYVEADIKQLSHDLDSCNPVSSQPDEHIELFLKFSRALCDRKYIKV